MRSTIQGDVGSLIRLGLDNGSCSLPLLDYEKRIVSLADVRLVRIAQVRRIHWTAGVGLTLWKGGIMASESEK
jgi:hypothetical protein